MPQLENFVAWVSIDDHPLQEYGVQYSEDLLTVVCWIASEEAKPFTISWRDSVRSQASMGRTFVDGEKCGVPKGINRSGYKKDPSNENDTAHQRGVRTSSGEERLLVFSKVNYIAEETYRKQGPMNRIGEIRLEISYVQKRGPSSLRPHSFQAEGKIHETAKQLTPHCTRLGCSVKGERKPVHSVKTTGRTRVFIFNYRPFGSLDPEILRVSGFPQVQEPVDKSIKSSSDGSKPSLDPDVDTKIKQEYDCGNEVLSWQVKLADQKIKTESGGQRVKKEEDTKVKIEEAQFKVEENYVKTEIMDMLVCKIEDIPKIEDGEVKAEAAIQPANRVIEIIDLTMED